LDENDEVLGPVYGYRDHRTDGVDRKVYEKITLLELYRRTGIQKQIFNTIYQLYADKLKRPDTLEKAKTFLMLPDYFTFLLTGQKASEYTNATSTQLVDPKTKQWDKELIRMLGLPEDIFLELNLPGTKLKNLKPEIAEEVGYDCDVIMTATHDTASAVMAMPCTDESGLYISSGTWSLMGTELSGAQTDDRSCGGNFTNEGGYEYRFRYLKNIMGLWMIQQVRHEAGDKLSFAEYATFAEVADDFGTILDVNDPRFLSPENMTDEIQSACVDTDQPIPQTPGEYASVIYKSLAECYKNTVAEIEENTNRTYDAIHIIGGGCNNDYLNRLTAKASGKKVYAGPSEATAIGNALAQMIAGGEFGDLSEARACVKDSFDIKVYES
jgi:rhamnulokinase